MTFYLGVRQSSSFDTCFRKISLNKNNIRNIKI